MIRQVIVRNCQKLISQNQLRFISLSSRSLSGVQQSDDVTHFGFETVKTSEKSKKGEFLRFALCSDGSNSSTWYSISS